MNSQEEDEDEDDDIISYKSVKESDEPKTDNTNKERPQSNDTTVNEEERQKSRKNGRENRSKNHLDVNKINTGKTAKINEIEKTVNEIYIKNEILEEIKAEIKKCTNSEVMKILKQFYDREYNRLQPLIVKAIILQNNIPTTSRRSWAEIPIATKLEEDTMTLHDENIVHSARVQLLKNSQQKEEIKDAREQKVMQKVLKIQANSSSESITISTSSEDSAHSKLRLHLQNEESSSNAGEKNLNSRVNNIENELSHNIKSENISHVQPINSSSRYSDMKDIENKIAILSNKKKILIKSSSPQMRTTALYRSKLKRLEDEILKLKEKTGHNLSNGEEKCQRNLSSNEKKVSLPILEDYRPQITHDSNAELLRAVTSASHENTPSRNMENDDAKRIEDKINETDELKRKYVSILLQYEKLVAEQKELLRTCGNNRSNDIKNENSPFFKNKLKDFLEEQKEFKYILNEQEIQLEEYQDKYMNAQQRIDELQNIIEELETSNIKNDTQLHAEIAKIQCKFQKKIAELSVFPKLLQDEQHKLAKCSQENEDLIQKLCIVCNELKIMKERFSQASTEAVAQKSSLVDTEKIKQELQIAQQAAYLAEKDRGMLTEELLNVTDQFNTLRSKSAAILARNQERTEKQKDNLKNRIDQLEKQLAFARSQISRTIIDRDERIKEIEAKLESTLCKYHVAVAENKTLKNHINYLTDQLGLHQVACSSVKGKEDNNVRF